MVFFSQQTSPQFHHRHFVELHFFLGETALTPEKTNKPTVTGRVTVLLNLEDPSTKSAQGCTCFFQWKGLKGFQV